MNSLVLTIPWQFSWEIKVSWAGRNEKLSMFQLGDGYHGFIRDRVNETEEFTGD